VSSTLVFRDAKDVPSLMSTARTTPTLAVLCGEDGPPPDMQPVEAELDVRYAAAADLPRALDGAEVLFVWDFLSTALADAWPAGDALRWVHVAGAGVDRVLTPPLVHSDVVVTNSRGVFERPIAEYVLGLLLAFAKDLPRTVRLQSRHRWQHRQTGMLAGHRAVVVGSGPIGQEIATVLRAVGMQVRVLGRAESAELPAHVTAVDYLVGAAPLTDLTRDLFDRTVFEAMPPTARFVNVGRGPSVVEEDLIAALRAGTIAGAALDVFDTEPLPGDHPLWDLEDVIVSPHMSGDRFGWREALAELFLDNLDRYRSGQSLHNVVDKQLGYVPGR
jgi:phosphoglycerate dehydrogenase-like enzyme